MARYVQMLFERHCVALPPKRASYLAGQMAVQSLSETKAKKLKLNIRNRRKRHVTTMKEVQALWGDDGIDANALVLGPTGDGSRAPARMVDSHAGSGAIGLHSMGILRGALLPAAARHRTGSTTI